MVQEQVILDALKNHSDLFQINQYLLTALINSTCQVRISFDKSVQ